MTRKKLQRTIANTEGKRRRTCSRRGREQSAPLSPLTTHYILVCRPERGRPLHLASGVWGDGGATSPAPDLINISWSLGQLIDTSRTGRLAARAVVVGGGGKATRTNVCHWVSEVLDFCVCSYVVGCNRCTLQ